MNEFPGLVDSHLHLLSLAGKGLDPRQCLDEFFEAGGRWALDVAVDTNNWETRLTYATNEPRLWLTTGIHPSEAHHVGPRDLSAVADQSWHPRCKAIGEIGLDWYRGREYEEVQRAVFRDQLTLALTRNLPVVIHNREADTEVLEDLERVGWTGTGIQHCFSSDQGFARQVLDKGFFISFAGNLTYPSAANLRSVAAWVPLDRLLVETDSPYLSPQPVRGQPNRPRNAGLTVRYLAELRGLPVDEILRVTGENFSSLLGLSSSLV